jgi:hypothetical protein
VLFICDVSERHTGIIVYYISEFKSHLNYKIVK